MIWLSLALGLLKLILQSKGVSGSPEGKVVGEFLEGFNAKVANAKRARDDVSSGRVPIDPKDPNDRANRDRGGL